MSNVKARSINSNTITALSFAAGCGIGAKLGASAGLGGVVLGCLGGGILGSTVFKPGCGDEVSEPSEELSCFRNTPEGHTTCNDGKNSVTFMDGISEVISDVALPKIEEYKQKILDLFKIDTPWRHQTLLFSSDTPCSDGGSIACAGGGNIYYPVLGEEKIEGINETLEKNRLPHQFVLLVHEMSHSLRMQAADFDSEILEEGMAHFTEDMFKARRYEDSQNVSSRYFYGKLSIGDTATFAGSSEIIYMRLDNVEDDRLNLSYAVRKTIDRVCSAGRERECHISFPFEVCDRIRNSNVFICNEKQDNDSWLFRAYDFDGSFYFQPVANKDGIKIIERQKTVDGEFVLLDPPITPYSLLNAEDDARILGLAYWLRIKNNYGLDGVRTILQSMVAFAKEHESVASFPFFQTFMDVTGLNEAESKTFFKTHYAPIEDESYPLGGIPSWFYDR